MISVVNPLIFRSKYFPFYKNKINLYYNTFCNIYPLLLQRKLIKYDNIVINVYVDFGEHIFLCMNNYNKQFKMNCNKLFSFMSRKQSHLTFNSIKKVLVLQSYSISDIVKLTIYYTLKQLVISKNNIRQLLLKTMFLLMNEYNLLGIKCVLSGRIRGVQRAKKEMFKIGDSSMISIFKQVKYFSLDIITKYGK